MLKDAFMIKNSLAASSVTLTPPTGDAYKVLNIHCIPNAAVTEFITATVDKTVIGFYHVGTTILNQLPFQDGQETQLTMFDQMRNMGYPLDIPIAEGETLTVSAPNNWTRLTIVYEIYDAADIKNTDLNGSKSKEYNFMQYGTLSSTITAAGTFTLDSVHNPTGFDDFPFGESVKSKRVLTILGIGAPTWVMTGAAHATDWISSTYLKLYKDREVLFDIDKNGLMMDCDTSVKAANTTMYYEPEWSQVPYGGEATYKPIMKLPVPIPFESGEELTVQATCELAGAGATVAVNTLYVCLPINVKKL